MVVRKHKCAVLLTAVIITSLPATAYAAGTVTPSPQSTLISKPAKQVLTQAQKEAIAAARSAFAAAKTDAQNGFGRALADAQAIRDQSILAAGKDKTALAAARKSYRDSYQIIMNAYKTNMKNAKAAFQAALAAAYSMRSTK